MSEDTPTRTFTDQMRRELAHRRILVLDGPLDDDNGTMLMTQLLTLAADQPQAEIALWIQSPGGSVPAMLAIRDMMKTHTGGMVTLALGWAASAGQFLLSAGTPGRRFALPHAKVLLHQGSSGLGGTAVDVELQAEDLRQTRNTTLALVAEDTGQPQDQVFDDSLRDRWFTASAARDYGFVDHVLSDMTQAMPRGARAPAGISLPAHRQQPIENDTTGEGS